MMVEGIGGGNIGGWLSLGPLGNFETEFCSPERPSMETNWLKTPLS